MSFCQNTTHMQQEMRVALERSIEACTSPDNVALIDNSC